MENINTTKISGSGTISGGEHGNIRISGSAKINGDIDCYDVHCSGSVHAYGNIQSKTYIKCSGSISCDQSLQAAEYIHCSGSCKTFGSLRAKHIHISGSCKTQDSIYGEEIKVSGSLSVANNVEGEIILLSGGCQIHGNMNGEHIELNPSDATMQISSIGGTQITVKDVRENTNFFVRFFGRTGGQLISELIEGDTVQLVNTECKIIRGKNIIIGANCKIDRVEYTESLTIDASAAVKEQIKF